MSQPINISIKVPANEKLLRRILNPLTPLISLPEESPLNEIGPSAMSIKDLYQETSPADYQIPLPPALPLPTVTSQEGTKSSADNSSFGKSSKTPSIVFNSNDLQSAIKQLKDSSNEGRVPSTKAELSGAMETISDMITSRRHYFVDDDDDDQVKTKTADDQAKTADDFSGNGFGLEGGYNISPGGEYIELLDELQMVNGIIYDFEDGKITSAWGPYGPNIPMNYAQWIDHRKYIKRRIQRLRRILHY